MTAYALILTGSFIARPTPEAGQCLPKDKNGSLQPLENSRKFCFLLRLSNTSAQPLVSFVTNAKPGNCQPASHPGIGRLGAPAASVYKRSG